MEDPIVNDPRWKYPTATLNGVKYNTIRAEPAAGKMIPFLLSKGLRVIAPDMMGHGGTDAPEDVSFYTLKHASDDIAALAGHLGLSRIILGGHDWGGAVVYRTALWHPELISAFFVFSTPFSVPRLTYVDQGVEIPSLHYMLQSRTDAVQNYIGLSNVQNTTRIRQILNTIYGVTLPDGERVFNSTGGGLSLELLGGVTEDTSLLSKEELDFYVESYASDPFNRTLNWYRTGVKNWEDELAFVPGYGDGDASYKTNFTQPALYIGGLLDPALPPVLSTGMEVYFDSLSRGEVNSSHWMMWDKPDEVNGHVNNWLTNLVLGNLNVTAGIGAGCALATR